MVTLDEFGRSDNASATYTEAVSRHDAKHFINRLIASLFLTIGLENESHCSVLDALASLFPEVNI